jgi:hypothetical protein
MANKKIIYMGLDYSQLDAGTTEINRKMGLLESQFKLTKEEIKSYGSEADQLSLKSEKLTQEIILQTKKVDLSKEAYDKAVASGKASDKQLDNLQKSYIDSQTKLQKLNNELAENKTKIDKAAKSADSFGGSIRNIASDLGINVSPALEGVASKFDGMDASVGNAIVGIGAIATAFIGCTVAAAGMADELLTLSSTSGVATDELQKMQYASEFLDVGTTTMTGSMTKLTRSMNDARNGSKELDEAFRTLHLRYKDNNNVLLDSQEVFYQTIDALGKIKNETERDALSMTVFGKSAKDLNPLIEAGSKRLRELGIEAEDMGLILSGQALEDLGQFDDNMQKMNATFEATKVQLGLVLLPVLTALTDWIGDIPAPVLSGVIAFGSMLVIFGLLTKAAQSMAIANALLSASNVTVGSTGIIATTGMGPLLLILLGIAAAVALIVGGAVGIKNAMNEVKDATSDIISSTNNAAANAQSAVTSSSRTRSYSQSPLTRSNASGTDNFPGGDTWVGEAGPEIVSLPRGSKIYSNSRSQELTGGGDTYNITIDARNVKEFNDVISIMQNYKQTVRQGRVRSV